MSIIVGTDLSAASAGALDVALALAKLSNHREVVLVHVADPALGGSPAARDRAFDDARDALEAQARERQAVDGPAIRCELVIGTPDQTLVELAETAGAQLIVIAARSTNSSLLRLGTTTAKVIARTTVPVVVVRDPAPWLAYARGERPLRVLLGIDDSACCELGIQLVHGLRARGPVEVVLGAIYYPDDASAHYGLDVGTLVDGDPEVERLMSRDLLRRFGGEPSASVVARPRHGLGRVGDHVVELARSERCDAIVVGTNQKTGFGRLGSVSSVIVDDATQSVVCVPPQARIPTQTAPVLRSAVVATDLSTFANRAVPYAFAMLHGDAPAVHLVHVIKASDAADPAALHAQLTALVPAGARHTVQTHVVRGDDPATAIAQAAARLGADAICIATHGRSGITRALVGSVADRLLRATRLPVLVLRA